MPKDRRDRSVSSDRFTASPHLCSSSRRKHRFAGNCLENKDNVKEWEEAQCPVCMEHPHNAILLLCSSHDKGCRPFMCDTSYRHSNCFDQFKKSFAKDPETTEEGTISVSASHLISDSLFSEATITNTSGGRNEVGSSSMNPILLDDQAKPNLMCPLCRGEINGWIIVDTARRFMNAKARSCACETCDFSGTYSDLRKHARTEHPYVRPTMADPERQRNWSRMERRRDFGDLISSLQSSIEGGETTVETSPEFDEGNWHTVFFLVRIFRAGSNSRSSGQSVVSRARRTTGRRSRRLWGEPIDEEVQSRPRNGSSNTTPAPGGDYTAALHQNEHPGRNTRSSLQSTGSSGTRVVNLGRRLIRQRGESPDNDEVHYYSSDGGPEHGRRLHRRRRTSSETSSEN
ncbi:hypothetical protein Leryth_012540 [Lithospermum erythrorhizon]|nr:hypothetical protein Leryth_012540 [Lithospermum erythrorhizon]